MSTESQWQPIETAPEYETVLTIHVKDLNPVCAFRLHHAGKDIWLRTLEGPEDIIQRGDCEQLYRPPTHWMPLRFLQIPRNDLIPTD